MTRGAVSRQPTFPTARWYLLFAFAFIAFAFYASLVPFNLERVSAERAWEQFRIAIAVAPRRISRTDVVANVLLFVPIGFFLGGGLLVDRRWRPIAIAAGLPILIFSTSVSIVLEYLQTFFKGRVPSSLDIGAQVAGCLIGFAGWLVAGDAVTRWLRAALATRREERLSRLLVGYLAAWILVSLAPFDITVDLGDLAARVRSGAITIAPFTAPDYSVSRHLWAAIAVILSTAPVGAFARIGWNRPRLQSPAAAFAVGASLVVLLELGQVFIVSRTAAATDVLFGWIGVSLGIALARGGPTRTAPAKDLDSDTSISWKAVAAFAAACLLLAAYHWQPFDFRVDRELIKQKLAGLSPMPFAAYIAGSYLNALSDLLTKVALSMPLWMLVAAGVFSAIEAGQFFLPMRVPDPTDVLVGLIGTFIGLSVVGWLRADR
jgi:VanZ family protein